MSETKKASHGKKAAAAELLGTLEDITPAPISDVGVSGFRGEQATAPMGTVVTRITTPTAPTTSTTLDTLKQAIKQELTDLTASFRTSLNVARNIGDLLNKVKVEATATGVKWLVWVKNNCGFSLNTATNYMRIANNWQTIESQFEYDEMTYTEALKLLSTRKPTGGGVNVQAHNRKKAGAGEKVYRITPKPGYTLDTIRAVLETMATVEEVTAK